MMQQVSFEGEPRQTEAECSCTKNGESEIMYPHREWRGRNKGNQCWECSGAGRKYRGEGDNRGYSKRSKSPASRACQWHILQRRHYKSSHNCGAQRRALR